MKPTDKVNNNLTLLSTNQDPLQLSKKSYANATVNDVFPVKEQGIIIEASEGISINDYVNKLATIVNPQDIRFASRISNNRICIFLSSAKTAEFVTNKYPKITINNQTLIVRPLISKLKRIIISNVCPVIPHEIIQKELSNHNIDIKSSISFIRAGISNPGFAHIMSFRRQAYILPEDINKLPDSTTISHEDTIYRIFFSTDDISCFLCKQPGHKATQCNKNPAAQSGSVATTDQHAQIQTSLNNQPPDSIKLSVKPSLSNNVKILSTPKSTPLDKPSTASIKTNNKVTEQDALTKQQFPKEPHLSAQAETNETNTIIPNSTDEDYKPHPKQPKDLGRTTIPHSMPEQEAIEIQPHNNLSMDEENFPLLSKRKLTSRSSSPSEQPDSKSTNKTTAHHKQQTKKKKKNKLEDAPYQEHPTAKSVDELLEPTKEEISSNQVNYPLTYSQFKLFIENVFGASDPILIAKAYVQDIQSIIQMMNDTYPFLTERSIKNRYTRIIKKLKSNSPPQETSETDNSTD